jgi:hypothetical protein
VAVGAAGAQITLPGANLAVAYDCSDTMFQQADGILGLAYAPLDDAFALPENTWTNKYPSTQVRQGKSQDIQPFLTQLSATGVVADKIAFLTRRSFVHEGGGGADDPLNQGWMILGGGEESTDLYTGEFQVVSVLSDAWYCTNLKSVKVGDTAPITARLAGPKGMPSNSIIDSGTNSLNLGPQMLTALLAKFTPAQRALLSQSIHKGQPVPMTKLDLATWPTITFVLQGDAGDVSLEVAPGDYWQVNTGAVGQAMAAITPGQAGLAILGLPLMNGYFTIFDGEADGGRGVVKFATAVR